MSEEINLDALLSNIYNENMSLPDPSLVQYYNDFENRTYWLDGEINNSTLDLVSKIIFWNRQDKGILIEERKPIKILFNSCGGDLDVEETICSIISLSKTPIWGIAIGQVASAASLIYLYCHKRFALESAYWVFHKGMGAVQGNYEDLMSSIEDYKKQVDKLVKTYSEKTKFTEEEVNENISRDWYVRFPVALEKGVADEIIKDIDILL